MKLLDQGCTQPLSVKEKDLIKKVGLSLKQLGSRYQKALARIKIRGTSILPRYQFYRQTFNAYVRYRAIDKTTPWEQLDIHSWNGSYMSIQLLERVKHKQLHSELARQKALAIKELGQVSCKYCGRTFELSSKYWVTNEATLVGLELGMCKKCRSERNRELKQLREAI